MIGNRGGRRGSVDHSQTDGAPIKPALSDEASRKWDDLTSQIQVGVLRRIDSHELKMLANLLALDDWLAEIVADDPADYRAQRAWLSCVDRVHKLSVGFGLNPNDRKRLGDILTPPKEEEDPYSDLISKGESVN